MEFGLLFYIFIVDCICQFLASVGGFSFLVGLLTPYKAKVTLYFCIMEIMYLLPVNGVLHVFF